MPEWYPGHMRRALGNVLEWASKVDVVFEVVDARAPYTTSNARMISRIAALRPVVKLLNKSDLADPDVTRQWIEYFKNNDVTALPMQSTARDAEKRIKPLLENLRDSHRLKRVRLLVVGIPNVGKSTWINALAKKKKARVGPTPGVTRGRQWVSLGVGIEVLDTPGILDALRRGSASDWKLAVLACIKPQPDEEEDAVFKVLSYGLEYSPEQIINDLGIDPGSEPMDAMQWLAKSKGFLLGAGEPDLSRAVTYVLKRFREGKLGKISLETPEDFNSAEQEQE